jgi:hypothetical protein
MPLVPTGRHRGWEANRTVTAVGRGLAGIGLVLVLAACNTGSMNEARRSQEYDVEVEAQQVAAQQATRTAAAFGEGTATPDPGGILAPSVETLVMTLGVNPDGSPSGSYLSLPVDAGTVYASALLGNVQAGQRAVAIFTDAAGNQVGSAETEMTANAASQWLVAPLNMGNTTGPGEYAVYLYSGGHQIASLAFSITGAGSGAQLLPDPPANPQARQPTPASQGRSTATAEGQDQNQDQQQGSWNQGQDGQGNTGDQNNQQQGTWEQEGQQDTWQQDQQNSGQQETVWVQQPDGTWVEQPAEQQWQSGP